MSKDSKARSICQRSCTTVQPEPYRGVSVTLVMKIWGRSLILVRNILQQGDEVPLAVTECLDAVNQRMEETLGAFSQVEIG
jgi:hypothetical protein